MPCFRHEKREPVSANDLQLISTRRIACRVARPAFVAKPARDASIHRVAAEQLQMVEAMADPLVRRGNAQVERGVGVHAQRAGDRHQAVAAQTGAVIARSLRRCRDRMGMHAVR